MKKFEMIEISNCTFLLTEPGGYRDADLEHDDHERVEDHPAGGDGRGVSG